MTDAADDGIVILRVVRPASAVLTKKIRQTANGWEVFGEYGKASLVRAEEFSVRDLDTLAAVLTESATDPKLCAIRGGIRPERVSAASAPEGVRRLAYDRPGVPASFEERARRWVACDIDSFDLPAFVDPINDIEHVIDEALQQLPGAFQDASFFWQLTSGHGIKLGGRVRLWFWLSRPTTNRELKNWLSSSKVDPSVFGIVQPIYTAAPILPPGTPDLLPARSGVRAGANDEVDVPPPDVLSRHHGAYRNMDGAGGFVAATVEAALACMGDPPAYPHGRGFHAPVKAALSAAIRSAGSKVDQAALLARIDAALIERGHTRPEAYISARIRDARSWLDWFVRKAFENEAVHAAGPAACDAPSTHPTMETEGITAILNSAIGSFMDDAIVTSRARQSVEKTLAETNDWTGFGRPVAPLGQTALVAAGVGPASCEPFR